MNNLLNSEQLIAIGIILTIAVTLSGWLLAFLVSKTHKMLDDHSVSIARINEWIAQQAQINKSIQDAICINKEQEKKINDLTRKLDILNSNMRHCEYSKIKS